MSSGTNGFIGLDQIDDLTERLRELGFSITPEMENKAVEAGADFFRDLVSHHPNMPVSDLQKEHGKDHIEIAKAEDGRYLVGATEDHYYLYFHEVGAKSGTYKVGKVVRKTPEIPAKPFFRPAFEENLDEIQQAIAEVLRRELGL